MPEELEQDSQEGKQARERLGAQMLEHVAKEFNIPGLQLGVRYSSPIVAREDGPPPPDLANTYVPTAYPGCRAPHIADGASGSLLDRFGKGFTLLVLGESNAADRNSWTEAASDLHIPLGHVVREDAEARNLYGAELVLIRPDHHVAWRGAASADPKSTLLSATGGNS